MATLRQRRGQPAASAASAAGGGGTSAEYHPSSSAIGSDESSGEDEYLPIGPLSLYFPDALVREVMARDPGGEISFIEAEQALLHSDAAADGAVRHVPEQRRDRARRRAEGGDARGFSHHRELAEQLGAARGAGGGGGSTSQNIMRWLVSVASTAILVLVVLALLIVAMVDGVIEVPDSVKSAARVLADGRRPGRP